MVPTTRASGSRKAVQSGFRAPNRHQEVLDEMSMRPQACQSVKVGPIWTQSWLVLNLISLLYSSSSPFSEFLLTIPLSRSIFRPCSCSLRIRDKGSSPIPLHIRNTDELGKYRKLGPEKFGGRAGPGSVYITSLDVNCLRFELNVQIFKRPRKYLLSRWGQS